MRRSLALTLALAMAVLGCARGPGGGGGRELSSVEMRSFQTRTYDTTDTRLVMKAMINALQDIGYIIKTADADLGVLTAEKWTNVAHSKREVKKARKDGTSLANSQVFECTANVSPHGQQCRVRMTFQRKVLDQAGGVMEAQIIDDATFYQTFFNSVGKSVFLQKENV
jgi:hypothetical protein